MNYKHRHQILKKCCFLDNSTKGSLQVPAILMFYHCQVCNPQYQFNLSSSATYSKMTESSFSSETRW